MTIHSDNPDHGFQFPGDFELSAMGSADAQLETELPKLLEAAGIRVRHETVSSRASSASAAPPTTSMLGRPVKPTINALRYEGEDSTTRTFMVRGFFILGACIRLA